MGKRMTISLSKALEEDLYAIMNNRENEVLTKSQAFRNAIIIYKYLLDEIAKGNKITVSNQDDKIIKEIVMAHWGNYGTT